MAEMLSTLTEDDLYTGFTEVWDSETSAPPVVALRQYADSPAFRLQSYSSLPWDIRTQSPVGFTLVKDSLSGKGQHASHNKQSLSLHDLTAQFSVPRSIIPRNVALVLEVCADAVARAVAAKQAELATRLTDFVVGHEQYLVGISREAICSPGQIAFAGKLVAFHAVELGPVTELKPVVEGWEGQQGYMPIGGWAPLAVSSSPYVKLSA